MAGSIIYRGPSAIDGSPIVVIFLPRSTNVKTGDMCQTYIIRSDMSPMDASRTGADVANCGGCVHRGKMVDGQLTGRSCYVTLFQGPRAVYDAFCRGVYADLSGDGAAIAALGAGQLVRLGTYGDPAAVPVTVWDALLSKSAGHTGYSHQWKAPRLRAVMKYCQASCDSIAEADKATALGFGVFLVTPKPEPARDGFFICPASAEAGKVETCATCLACNGKGNRIQIAAHGTGAGHVARRVLPTL